MAAPLLAACAVTSPLAMAASADLQLNGEIVAGACDIQATNGGVYAYGDMVNDILTDTGGAIGDRNNTVSIVCPGPMYIALEVTDNNEGTEHPASPSGGTIPSMSARIGVGLDHQSNPIGYAAYWIKNTVVVNGAPGKLLLRPDAGGDWRTYNYWDYIGLDNEIGFTAGTGTDISPINSVDFDVSTRLWLGPKGTLDSSRELLINGSFTVEMRYL